MYIRICLWRRLLKLPKINDNEWIRIRKDTRLLIPDGWQEFGEPVENLL